jgi:phage gp29-like protein
MAQLLDQYGIPIPKRRIHEEIAGPSMTAFRRVWTGVYQSQGLTPETMASALRAADSGYEARYLHLAEEMEEKDGHYAAVLGVRKRAVEGLPVQVEAAGEDAESQKHAEFVREWVDTGVLQRSLFHMMDAVAKGFSVHEIEWETRPDRIRPHRLLYREAHWFGIDREDGQTVKLRDGTLNLTELPAWKFVIHKSQFKSGHLIRGGLARVAVWSWMFKAFSMKDWSVFVQNYGTPIRVGKYDVHATERDKEALWHAVRDIAGDTAAIIPASMDLEFIGVKDTSGSAHVYELRCKYLDQQLSKIVLGQTTTVDAIQGGHAVSQEHEKVRKDIEMADAAALSATLTRQLIPVMIAANFGPQERYPVLRIGRPDETPLKDIVDAVDKLGGQGLTVAAAEMRRRMGVPDPQQGEELVGGRPVAPSTPLDSDPADPADRKTVHSSSAIEPADVVTALVDRLAEEAGQSVSAMLRQIRRELGRATSLEDARARLDDLDLDTGRFDEHLARSLALAHLAGQATVIDQTEG